MNQSISTTLATSSWSSTWYWNNKAAEVTCGSSFLISFIIGTMGNIVSFLYFQSRKRDISNSIYMLTTVTDFVISITLLFIGRSFFSKRYPTMLFINKYSCAAWYYIFCITTTYLSPFLVLCLCVARTLSLLKPFLKQKIRYVVIAVTFFVAVNLAMMAILHSLGVLIVEYSYLAAICFVAFDDNWRHTVVFKFVVVSQTCLRLAQAVTVIVSCIISVVILTRKNKNVQQRELQQSRNRATVTILLFALLYVACNITGVVHTTMRALYHLTGIYDFITPYSFDTKGYFHTVVRTLLPQANSALNPILYFWRMKPLREYTVTSVKKILRLNKVQVRRPPANNKQ